MPAVGGNETEAPPQLEREMVKNERTERTRLRQELGFLGGVGKSLLPEVLEAVGEDGVSQGNDGVCAT